MDFRNILDQGGPPGIPGIPEFLSFNGVSQEKAAPSIEYTIWNIMNINIFSRVRQVLDSLRDRAMASMKTAKRCSTAHF